LGLRQGLVELSRHYYKWKSTKHCKFTTSPHQKIKKCSSSWSTMILNIEIIEATSQKYEIQHTHLRTTSNKKKKNRCTSESEKSADFRVSIS